MKQLIVSTFLTASLFLACKTQSNLNAIQPKAGGIEVPAKGEFRLWRNTQHSSFSVLLTNPSTSQSCEVYKVTSNGNEKWISPSLKAGKSLSVTIPTDGHLLITNFNPNTLTISYKVEE
jgi:hypothetical protein